MMRPSSIFFAVGKGPFGESIILILIAFPLNLPFYSCALFCAGEKEKKGRRAIIVSLLLNFRSVSIIFLCGDDGKQRFLIVSKSRRLLLSSSSSAAANSSFLLGLLCGQLFWNRGVLWWRGMAALGMYKNQLQELAQRSCFNLPSYSCVREGPDHAPRFKAIVNFNGELFESPNYCTTLKQAEHAAAEAALVALSQRGGPSQYLAAKILEETGVCKNLLQETAQRAGVSLPLYTTLRSGPGHHPVFKCIVEVAGMRFVGEPAKAKKQAEKNAAMAAWTALKQATSQGSEKLIEWSETGGEHEHRVVSSSKLGREEWYAWQHNNKDLDTNRSRGKLWQSRSRAWSHDRNLAGNYLVSPSVLELSFEAEQGHSFVGTDTGGGSAYATNIGHSQNTVHEAPYLSGESSRLPQNIANKGRGVMPVQMRGLPMNRHIQNHEFWKALEEHSQDEDEWLAIERDCGSYGPNTDRERIDSFRDGHSSFGSRIQDSKRSSSFREDHSSSFGARIVDNERSSSFRDVHSSSFGPRILDSRRSSSFREDHSSFGAKVIDSKRSSSFREGHFREGHRESHNNFGPRIQDSDRSKSFREDHSSFGGGVLDSKRSICFREDLDKDHSNSFREDCSSSLIWPPQSQWWADVPPSSTNHLASACGSSGGFKSTVDMAPPVRTVPSLFGSPSCQDASHQTRDINAHGDSFHLSNSVAPPVKVRNMVADCSSTSQRPDSPLVSQFREMDNRVRLARHGDLSLPFFDVSDDHHSNNFCFATNLAPPVRVRPMVAVCSAPPLRQDPAPPQVREIVDGEAVTRQMLSRMRL